MRTALIGITARGYVAELAAPIGGPEPRYCYRLFCNQGTAFAAKDDTSVRPHDMRSNIEGLRDGKLVHTEGAKKRAQRLLKARSWSYRSRVPVAKWSETSFDISSRVCLGRRKISARRVCSIAGRRVFSWRLLLDIPKLCRGRIFQRWRRRMRRVWRGAVAGLRWSGAEGWLRRG